MQPIDPSEGGRGLRLNLGGIPVRVDLSFLLIAVLFGWGAGDWTIVAVWVGVLAVSILVHELGHAITLRAFGVPSNVVLYAMGGVTMPARRLDERWRRVAVSLAGPFTGLFLLGIPAVLIERAWLAPTEVWDATLTYLIWVNVAWSFVNLLPVLPLDGGNVTKELLDAATDEHGEVPARVVSIVVAGGGRPLRPEPPAGLRRPVRRVLPGPQRPGPPGAQEPADPRRGPAGGHARSTGATWRPPPNSPPPPWGGRPTSGCTPPPPRPWPGPSSPAGDEASARLVLAKFPTTQTPSGHLRAFLTETDPAEQVNATVDAWLDETTPPPPPLLRRPARSRRPRRRGGGSPARCPGRDGRARSPSVPATAVPRRPTPGRRPPPPTVLRRDTARARGPGSDENPSGLRWGERCGLPRPCVRGPRRTRRAGHRRATCSRHPGCWRSGRRHHRHPLAR